MKIYVIRHGKTVANLLRVHNSADTELADIGIEEANKLKDKIKNIDYDVIISSPFVRTKHTAEIINVKNREIILDDRLKERDFGSLIGKELTDIDRNGYWDYYNEFFYDGCEDITTFFERVNNFIKELKTKKYKNILIVTHKGVSRAIEVYFDGIGDGKLFDKGIRNCEMEEFEL